MNEGGGNTSNNNHSGTNSRSTTASSGSSSSGGGSLEALRRVNASGEIPVRLTLAKTSLSSGTPPQPQHVLLSRQTFLHLGLEASIRKLHEHALPTLSFAGINSGSKHNGHTTVVVVQEDDEERTTGTNKQKQGDENGDVSTDNSNNKDGDGGESSNDNDDDDKESSDSKTKEPPPYPICWFEDVVTEQPLRWQYFVGVLFDSLHPTPKPSQPHPKSNEDKDHHPPTSSVLSQPLPWEIRVHFRSYPSKKLLELCDADLGGVLDTLRRIFMNSLKQGFVVRYGNSKEALNLSKKSHEAIWKGITQKNYGILAPIVFRDDEFGVKTPAPTTTRGEPDTTTAKENEKKDDDGNDTQREQKNDGPPGPLPNDTTIKEGSGGTTDRAGNQSSGNNNRHENNNLAAVPVRLSIDPTKPMIQRRCGGGKAVSGLTLGSLLLEWAPSHFERIVDTSGHEAVDETVDKSKPFDQRGIQPRDQSTSWKVAGLTPPLSTPLLDLWLALRHPDNFLYISLSVEPR